MVTTRALRNLVTLTRDWPGLGRTYRGIYAWQVARARRMLARRVDISGAALRGSAGRSPEPGLSDIDWVVVLDHRLPAAGQLEAARGVWRGLERINLAAPLHRDVHFFTAPELAALSASGDPFVAFMRDDLYPVADPVELPPRHACADCEREAVLRGAGMWGPLGVGMLLRGDNAVARLLAGGMLERATRFAEAASGDVPAVAPVLQELRRCPRRHRAGWSDALSMLRTLERAWPDAPANPDILAAPASPALPGVLLAWANQVAAPWCRLPAVLGVSLATEIGGDVRLIVVLDPGHTEAESSLAAMAGSVRAMPPLPAGFYSRAPLPLVVGPRVAAQPVFLRWTAAEPWQRPRGWRAGAVPEAVTTPAQMARGLLYDALNAPSRIRWWWAQRPELNRPRLGDQAALLAAVRWTLAHPGARPLEIPAAPAVELPETGCGASGLLAALTGFVNGIGDQAETLSHRLARSARHPDAGISTSTAVGADR